MIKSARAKSTDPVQEQLREHKAEWNKSVSIFIDNLINLKKTMNGYPSKFHMERSMIGEELPRDPASIIGVLASDFAEIADGCNKIIQEQANYSKTRRRKQVHASTTFKTTSSIDWSQINAFADDYILLAEAALDNVIDKYFRI